MYSNWLASAQIRLYAYQWPTNNNRYIISTYDPYVIATIYILLCTIHIIKAIKAHLIHKVIVHTVTVNKCRIFIYNLSNRQSSAAQT